MASKTVLCIRHGESTFNAIHPKTGIDPLLYDSCLSDAGRKQVELARDKLRGVAIDLVVTSPLTRALESALGLFADHPCAPPIIAEALHRERVLNSCDIGRSPALLAKEFPSVPLEHLPEIWWHNEGAPDERGVSIEPIEAVTARADAFRQLLLQRPERAIAVVGHGTFFYYFLGKTLANCEIVEIALDSEPTPWPTRASSVVDLRNPA